MFKKFFAVVFVGLVGLVGVCSNSYAEIYSSISGRVVDADTGEGIEGAEFVLLKTKQRFITDYKGFFKADNVKPGIHGYKIVAPKNNPHYIKVTPAKAIEVISGKDITNFNLKLKGAARIEGILYSSDGEILSNTTVFSYAFNKSDLECSDNYNIVKSKTDENGKFILDGVATDTTVMLNVTLSAIDRRVASFVLSKNQTLKRDFVIHNNGSQQITGIVYDVVSNEVLKNISVSINMPYAYEKCPNKGINIEIAKSVTNENGEYVIKNLKPGNYQLFAYDFGGNQYNYQSLKVNNISVEKDTQTTKNIFLKRK